MSKYIKATNTKKRGYIYHIAVDGGYITPMCGQPINSVEVFDELPDGVKLCHMCVARQRIIDDCVTCPRCRSVGDSIKANGSNTIFKDGKPEKVYRYLCKSCRKAWQSGYGDNSFNKRGAV